MTRRPIIPARKLQQQTRAFTQKINTATLIQESLTLINSNRHVEARAKLESILKIQANHFDALHLLGVLFLIGNQHAKAADFLSKAIKVNPNFVDAYSNRGVTLQILKRLDEALLDYDKAISINPNFVDAYSNRGNALKELGRLDEALLDYDKAISINPNFAKIYLNRGNTLKDLKRFNEALLDYDKAISLNPNLADAHSNRGDALKELGRLDEALLNHETALHINPNLAGAYINLGVTLHALGRLDDALASYDSAIKINPGFADAHSNRGVTLHALGLPNEAINAYEKTIQIHPDHVDANWNLALTNLLMGNFRDGWRRYEWGWKNNARGSTRIFHQPLWLGEEPLRDKIILVYAEQGLGDIIQFCRYLYPLSRLGAQVIFEVPKKLAYLMRNVKGISEIVLSGDPLPPFDYQCPLMSLPLAFNTEINSIPHEIKYLYVPIEATSQVKLELHKNNKKLRIGISWHSVAKGVGANRSIKLIELIQGINLDNIEFVNLQYGDVADEIEYVRHSLGINVIQSTVNNYDDIVGLAALIETCDLVVSIDNTTIHLAGALGKPTLVLLPFVADWRWLLDRNDSPWYPSLKLYRQNARGDWGNVLEKIKRDLVSLSTQEKLN